MKHRLSIISLNAAQAECRCLKWSYEKTCAGTKDEILAEYRKHLNKKGATWN